MQPELTEESRKHAAKQRSLESMPKDSRLTDGANGMSADDVFSWANWVLVVSLALGVLATGAIVLSGKIREERFKSEIAYANQRAEEAKAETAKTNLELEKLHSPRTLTVDQQLRISKKLKAFQGTTFEIVTYPHVPEPSGFSHIIAETLHHAGWVIQGVDSHKFLLGLATGVVVTVDRRSGHDAEQAGEALLASLTAEGVMAKLGHADLVTAIKIQVGQKP